MATLSQRVASGATSSPTLKLTRAGKRLVAHKKRLPLTVTVTIGSPTAMKTLKLTLVR